MTATASADQRREKRRDALIAVALIAITVLAYLPAFRAGWIWDDDFYVTENVNLREDDGLWRIWTRLGLANGGTPQYYPLVHTTFWVEHALWGLDPRGYHAVNILLHATAAILLWRVLAILNVPAAPWAAALWAVHPVNVESVAWVTERKNVLSAVFYLAALRIYLKSLRPQPPVNPNPPLPESPHSERPHPPANHDAPLAASRPITAGHSAGSDSDQSDAPRRSSSSHAARQLTCHHPLGATTHRYWTFLLLFTCALLSKTVTATLPAAILVILWWKRGRITRRDVTPLLPLFVIGAAMGALTGYVERHYVGAHGPDFDLTPAGRLLVAGRAVWFYLAKVLWPTNLSFIYEKWSPTPHSATQWLYPVAATALTLALWLLRHKIGRAPAAAWFLFCGTLFPALGFVSVYPFRYSYVADHFQYLASAAVITAAASSAFGLSRFHLTRSVRRALRHAAEKRRTYSSGAPPRVSNTHTPYTPNENALVRSPRLAAARRAGLIPHIIFLFTTIALSTLTHTRTTIFHNARTLWTDTIRTNPKAWMARNNLAGIMIHRGEYAAAAEQLAAIQRGGPDLPELHINLGLLAEARGDDAAATREFQEAIRLGGRDPAAVYNLARMVEKRGDGALAEELYREVLNGNPADTKSRANLGKILADTGRPAEAEAMYRDEIALNPSAVPARVNWALLKMQQGDFPAAEKLLTEARALDPQNPAALNALGGIRWSQGNLPEAEALFRDALRLREEFPEAHSNLAGVLAAQGNPTAARQHYSRALELNPTHPPALRGLQRLDETMGNPPQNR